MHSGKNLKAYLRITVGARTCHSEPIE